MQVLPAAAALAALGGALRRAPMDVAFAEINWSKLAQTFALVASSPRTSGLAQVSLNGAGGSNQHVRSSIVAASDRQRQDIVADYLRRKVATVLKVEPAAIELERPLQELGLDLADRVRAEESHRDRAGVAPPVGKFPQRPTIATIAPAVVEAINTDSRTGAIDPRRGRRSRG